MSIDRLARNMLIISVLGLILRSTQLMAGETAPLDLVNQSVAICLEVSRPAESWTQIQQCRMAARFMAFPPVVRLLNGKGFQQWRQIEAYSTTVTGSPLSRLILDICAESLVLAIYLPDKGKPQGVMIAQARDESTLRRAIEAWDKLDPKQVKVACEHRGISYTRREKNSGSKDAWCLVPIGRILVVSDHESQIRQAIEQFLRLEESGTETTEVSQLVRPLREAPAFRQTRSRLPADAMAYLHVNSRRWDQAFLDGVKNDQGAMPLLNAWKKVSVIGAALRIGSDFVVDVVSEIDPEFLPQEWTQDPQSTSAKLFWKERIPDGTLASLSGTTELRPLISFCLDTILGSKTDAFSRGRRAARALLMGRDLFDDVIPLLLSDVTVLVSSRGGESQDPTPFHLSAIMRWSTSAEKSNDRKESPATLAACVDNALIFGMNFLAVQMAIESSVSQMAVDGKRGEDSGVRSLKGMPIWEPSYRVVDGCLVISSSPTLAVKFSDQKPVNKDHDDSNRVALLEQKYLLGMTQLIWIDSALARKSINEHRNWITEVLSHKSQDSRSDIERRLSNLMEILGLADGVFLAGRLNGSFVHIVFGGITD